jgi:hypothetical protein
MNDGNFVALNDPVQLAICTPVEITNFERVIDPLYRLP